MIKKILAAMLALFALPHIEQHIKKDYYYSITVTLAMSGISDSEIRSRLEEAGARVQKLDLDYDLANQSRTLHCDLKLRRGDVFKLSHRIIESLVSAQGVTRVKWG